MLNKVLRNQVRVRQSLVLFLDVRPEPEETRFAWLRYLCHSKNSPRCSRDSAPCWVESGGTGPTPWSPNGKDTRLGLFCVCVHVYGDVYSSVLQVCDCTVRYGSLDRIWRRWRWRWLEGTWSYAFMTENARSSIYLSIFLRTAASGLFLRPPTKRAMSGGFGSQPVVRPCRLRSSSCPKADMLIMDEVGDTLLDSSFNFGNLVVLCCLIYIYKHEDGQASKSMAPACISSLAYPVL